MPVRPLPETLREYGRGVGGGLLFSLPMLYTMEVWATGAAASPGRLLALVGGTVALLVAYSHAGGLRADPSLGESLFEAAEELGLGLLTAAGVLWLVGELGPGVSRAEALGKVVVEGMVAAVGVSIGTAQLGQALADDGARANGARPALSLVALGALGAVVVAANVAPTDEVVAIAAAASPGRLLVLLGASLGVAAVLQSFSDVRGADRAASPFGPAGGAVVTVATALGVSAALLWVFGRLDGLAPSAALAAMVVLGFPATLGAAAGRLLLGTDTGGSDG